MSEVRLLQGDCLAVLKTLDAQSVNCVITSPPYYGLRDYGTAKWEGGNPECLHRRESKKSDKTITGHKNFDEMLGVGDAIQKSVCAYCGAIRIDSQIGLEQTPDEYVKKLVDVFREVKRVLRDDGTLWLNLGDSYSSFKDCKSVADTLRVGGNSESANVIEKGLSVTRNTKLMKSAGLKNKDLIGIPWRVAFALQQPYRVPDCINNDIDRAWLASMFDGEGCIGVRRFDSYREEKQQVYQDGFVVYTTVTNNDIPLLDRCIEITGYGKVALKSAAESTDKRGIVSRRDSYGWRLDGNKAVDVIRAIYPYLIAKRKQACIAYTLDDLNKNGHGSRSVPTEIQEKKAYLKELINKCNQREAIDLPSWIKEPKPEIEPGWYLRQDIIWAKPNPMPESVKDRCTKAHEYIFLLTKNGHYYYDSESIKDKSIEPNDNRGERGNQKRIPTEKIAGIRSSGVYPLANKRSVWTVTTKPFKEAHFATFPEDLIRPCVLAGCPEGGVILDPFNGAGTTGVVAVKNGRNYIGIELNPEYIKMSEKRIAEANQQQRLF